MATLKTAEASCLGCFYLKRRKEMGVSLRAARRDTGKGRGLSVPMPDPFLFGSHKPWAASGNYCRVGEAALSRGLALPPVLATCC